jgi:flagellar FliJ protein
MAWTTSLIRIADHEIEELRKRLAEIVGRRSQWEMALAVLDAEAESETQNARTSAEAGWYLVGFREGWKIRRAKLEMELRACELEEAGARDALSAAFEARKKVETVAQQHAAVQRKAEKARDSAEMDALALRRATRA